MPDLTPEELDEYDRKATVMIQRYPSSESPRVAVCARELRTLVRMARRAADLEETIKVLSDPKAMEMLRQGEEDLAAGRLINHDEVKRQYDDKHQRRRRNDGHD